MSCWSIQTGIPAWQKLDPKILLLLVQTEDVAKHHSTTQMREWALPHACQHEVTRTLVLAILQRPHHLLQGKRQCSQCRPTRCLTTQHTPSMVRLSWSLWCDAYICNSCLSVHSNKLFKWFAYTVLMSHFFLGLQFFVRKNVLKELSEVVYIIKWKTAHINPSLPSQ